jgi:sugar phosphate isomerase/epimerase
MELSACPESTLNPDTTSDKKIAQVKADLEEHDIEISAIGYYPNYLDPDARKAEEAKCYFLKILDLAVRLQVGIVGTFVGRNPDKSVQENISLFKEVFSRFCDEAEKRDIKIAIENCPMLDRFHLRGENIAFSPEVWDEMYKAVPSKSLGIELDPSHMVWQGIDYIQAIYNYSDRIFHIHAKDIEINRRVLARVGILGQVFGEPDGPGHGWWRVRTPGYGTIDWTKFISALLDVKYPGNVDIESEDDVFFMSSVLENPLTKSVIAEKIDQEEEKLILGYATFSRLIPSQD